MRPSVPTGLLDAVAEERPTHAWPRAQDRTPVRRDPIRASRTGHPCLRPAHLRAPSQRRQVAAGSPWAGTESLGTLAR